MTKGTQYSKQFKEDAVVRYRKDYPELTVQKVVENFGISESALKNWMKAARENEGYVPTRGTGNYFSDESKEIARIQKELRDTKNALEILKSNQYPGKITEAIYTATSEYITEVAELPQKYWFSVSGYYS